MSADFLSKLFKTLMFFVIAMLVWHLFDYMLQATHALSNLDEINYGEGIVWQQAQMMMTPFMYGDINNYPYIVFHYPPLFHWISNFVNTLGVAFPAAGRLVSQTSTLLLVLTVAVLAYRISVGSEKQRGLNALLSGLSVMIVWPVLYWSQTMRVDMLGILLSFIGLLFSVRSLKNPLFMWPAILAFVLAIWTKQTELAAPLAAIPILIFYHRKKSILPLTSMFIISLCALVWMETLTQGGFLKHIVGYNINRFSLDGMKVSYFVLTAQLPLIVLAFLGYRAEWKGVNASVICGEYDKTQRFALLILTVHIIISTLLSIVTLFKSGSDVNYLIEPLVACTLPIGWLFAKARDYKPSTQVKLAALLLFSSITIPVPTMQAQASLEYFELLSMVEKTSKPVLSDDMVVLMQAGKQVPWESAIFAELSAKGVWDQQKVIERIKQKEFGFLILFKGNLGRFDSRYTPEIQQAISRYYPNEKQVGKYTVASPE